MGAIAKVAVDLEANSASFMSGLSRADAALAASGRKWQRNLASIDASFSALGATLGTVFAGIGAGAAVSTVFAVNAEFQKLSASLKTVTGSVGAAQAAMGMIKEFAAETPYQLSEVTDAFIKLKALGLDATIDSLRSYGNTASALGKPINQMIEAVADAATGEFERLKEFGIKAKSEGDKVTFTFRGIATTVRKEAGEIESYLRRIGEVEFAGAMAEQMATLGGAASNLKDQFDALMTAIGEAGVNDVMITSLRTMTELLAQAGQGVNDWTLAWGKMGQASTAALEDSRSRLESWIATLERFRDSLPKFLRPAEGSDPLLDGYIQSRKTKLGGVNEEIARRSPIANLYPSPRPDRPAAAPSEAESKQADAITKQIAALRFQEEQLGRTAREQAIYAAVQRAGAQATAEQRAAIAAAAGSLYDKTEAVNAATEAVERQNKVEDALLEEQFRQQDARDKIATGLSREVSDNERLIAALRVSEAEYERVAALLELTNQYRQAGLDMSPEEIRAMEEMARKLGEQRTELGRLKDAADSAKKLGADLGMTFSSAFEDAIISAKSLSQVLESLGQDILRLMVRSQITQPLAKAASPLFGSLMSGIGGFLGFATGTDSAPPGMAWVGERGPELVKFRGGEQVYPAMLSKQIAAAYNAPGFADGAFRLDDGGPVGGGINVNVINNAGADVTAQRRMTGSGLDLDIMVDQAVAKKLGQRGSSANRSMRQTFGARETLVTR